MLLYKFDNDKNTNPVYASYFSIDKKGNSIDSTRIWDMQM